MRSRFGLALAAAGALSCVGATVPAARAATEVPVFDGTLKFTKLNRACLDDGWRVGDEFTLVFRSAVRPSNKAGGGIQLLTQRYAHSMQLPRNRALPGGRSTGTFNVTGLSSQVGTYFYTMPFDLTVSPAIIDDKTKSVKITGTITGIADVPDCVATVSGTGKRRP